MAWLVVVLVRVELQVLSIASSPALSYQAVLPQVSPILHRHITAHSALSHIKVGCGQRLLVFAAGLNLIEWTISWGDRDTLTPTLQRLPTTASTTQAITGSRAWDGNVACCGRSPPTMLGVAANTSADAIDSQFSSFASDHWQLRAVDQIFLHTV